MKTCVGNQSERFLAGLLTASETTAFESHLETCPYCLEQLEREAGGEAGWVSARELLVHNVPGTASRISRGNPAFFEEVASGRESATGGFSFESEGMPACTSSVVLSILAPSDDPQYVGRIGAYEVSGIVGRGSAGIVLRGFDRALHRNVAIKVLDPSMADVGAARQRFAREARSMAAISHEHVVPVYEVSEHGGVPYFVMEYVPGGSLERRLRSDGPFEVESIVRIALQTAGALAAAHANGLVHRDIKPGNILIDRGTERVRVADFGLVRVANDASCTRSGMIAGTPQYMAPEQVKAEICDGRSDLFSLGSLMYALCTGHAPFRADTVYGVLQRIVHDEPRSIRESSPQIPEWLEDFIFRLMSKNREDRFANAEEVVRNLQVELSRLQNPELRKPLRQPYRHRSTPPKPGRSYRTSRMRVAAIGLLLAIFGVTSRAIWQIAGNGPTPSAGTQQPLQSPANESPDSSIGEKPANITRTDAQPTHADFWSSDESTLSASSTDASGLDSGNRNRLAQPESDSWNAQADELLNELNALEVDLNDPNWQSIRPVNNPVNPLPVKQIEGE